MNYSVAQLSNQGGRDYNEDSTAIFKREDAIMLIVADGLGGHAGGDLASQTFVKAMGDSFKGASDVHFKDVDKFLTLSINFAHRMIHRAAISRGFDVDSPKTTCVVCLIYKGVAQWAHSGDSRLYHINKRKILFITEDHVTTKLGVENAPINRCVGGLEHPNPEVAEPHTMQDGDILVLASDGAWYALTAEAIGDYIDPESPSLGLSGLLQYLEQKNKAPSDNLSIVIIFWGITQFDNPSFNDLSENDFKDHTTLILNDDENDGTFDIETLDTAIGEIEGFITDLDEKI